MPNVLLSVLPERSDHAPVLVTEVVDLLAAKPGEIVVDATFGAGGHSRALVKTLDGRGKLIAIERDPKAQV